ncbi:MAG: hypothetical protein ACUVS1_11815 [Actinomycetota bacterium]
MSPGEERYEGRGAEERSPLRGNSDETVLVRPGPTPGRSRKYLGLRAQAMTTVVFAVLAVCAVALLALFASRAPVGVAERYLLAMDQGRIDEAWAMLHASSDYKENGDLEGYQYLVKGRMDRVSGWEMHLSHLTGSRAYVDVGLSRDGEVQWLRIGLRNDGKGWEVYEPWSEEPYGVP